MSNEVFTRRMNDRGGYSKLTSNFLVFEDGERVVIKGGNVVGLDANNQRCIIIKNGCSYIISLDGAVNGSIKISFKTGNPRTIGVFSKSSEKKLNLGVKSYLDPRTFEFLETNSVLLDSIYYTVPVEYNTLFLEKTLNCCSTLGVRNVFYVFKVSGIESLLNLSSIIEFLDASAKKSIQEVFIILEDVIDINVGALNHLEDILLLFKDHSVFPVFSIPFKVVKNPCFDTREEFLENLENLKKVFVDAVAFVGNFPYNIAFDTASNTRGLTNDDWVTYVFGVNVLTNSLGSNNGVVMYNIPGGHTNSTSETSKFTRKEYSTHSETSKDFSSSAGLFFFGGLEDYQEQQNFWNDKISTGVPLPSHLNLAINKGIKFLLFGPKNEEEDTECVPCKNNCYTVLDDNYLLDCINTNFF